MFWFNELIIETIIKNKNRYSASINFKDQLFEYFTLFTKMVNMSMATIKDSKNLVIKSISNKFVRDFIIIIANNFYLICYR